MYFRGVFRTPGAGGGGRRRRGGGSGRDAGLCRAKPGRGEGGGGKQRARRGGGTSAARKQAPAPRGIGGVVAAGVRDRRVGVPELWRTVAVAGDDRAPSLPALLPFPAPRAPDTPPLFSSLARPSLPRPLPPLSAKVVVAPAGLALTSGEFQLSLLGRIDCRSTDPRPGPSNEAKGAAAKAAAPSFFVPPPPVQRASGPPVS